MLLPTVFLCVGLGKLQLSNAPLPRMTCTQHQHARHYEDLPHGARYASTGLAGSGFMLVQSMDTGVQYVVDDSTATLPPTRVAPTLPNQSLVLPSRK